MLETWVFMVGVLIVCLMILFHGLVLMIAPARSIPFAEWGPRRIELLRKPPLELGKRFVGLCLTLLVSVVFLEPVLAWMFHPVPRGVMWRDSGGGVARWDFFALGVFTLITGSYLLRRPEGPVRHLFFADLGRLRDKVTLRLWTTYIQAAGVFFVLFSVLMLNLFRQSLT